MTSGRVGISHDKTEICNDIKGTPMTRSDLIEIIARALCADRFVDPDMVGYKGLRQWERRIDPAESILAALSSAGLAVVPREATQIMLDEVSTNVEPMASMGDGPATNAGRWREMCAVGDLTDDSVGASRRAMVAAEDLAGERE